LEYYHKRNLEHQLVSYFATYCSMLV
jgi:hypothetical protein